MTSPLLDDLPLPVKSDTVHAVPRSVARTETASATDTLRVLTINVHRGQGPELPLLLEYGARDARERHRLTHRAKAYTHLIADWLRRQTMRHDVVGLQEVFHGLLGPLKRVIHRQPTQDLRYQAVGAFVRAHAHAIGHPAFRYQNLLLSRLPEGDGDVRHEALPCRVFGLARCGVTLAPVRWGDRTVWVGNTHLHAYHPKKRTAQAEAIAAVLRELGDVPILLMGDFNMVPAGCKDADFPHGGRDLLSYRGDRTFAVLAEAGLETVPHEDSEAFWTHPTGLPNRTLDYILFSRHWEVESYRVLRDFTLSDHLPVEGCFRLA